MSSVPASPSAPCFPLLPQRWGTCSSGALCGTNPDPRITRSTCFEGPVSGQRGPAGLCSLELTALGAAQRLLQHHLCGAMAGGGGGRGLGPRPRPLLGPLAGLWLVSERETGAEAPVTSSGAPPNNAETRGAIPPSDNDPLPATRPTRSRRDGRLTRGRPGPGLAVSDGGLAPLWPEDEERMDSLANGQDSWPVSGACAHPE